MPQRKPIAALALVLGLAGLLFSPWCQASFYLNEILFNPPSDDAPHQYAEIRGRANDVFPAGSWFVALAGDSNANPGTIENLVNLSGVRIGGNGFLVLLQKTNVYEPHSAATLLENTGSGPGFGSGSTSSIGHSGDGGSTELGHASVTFLLIQSSNAPALGADVDTNNDGMPDAGGFAQWKVWDSIGVLDTDGAGDVAYGKVNFRRNTMPGLGAKATGIVVSVSFTPSYVGRVGNGTNFNSAAWIASSKVKGVAPLWFLDDDDTWPLAYLDMPLNHIGAPNFGAAVIPGVILTETDGNTQVGEGVGSDSYTLALNVPPSGPVTVQITPTGQARVSLDGTNYASGRSIILSNTSPRTIWVLAEDDTVVDASPHVASVFHAITNTLDAARYPTNSLLPVLAVKVGENDTVLLNELKVNPPGSDEPWEFIELRGQPRAWLSNVWVLMIESDKANDPGQIDAAWNLTGTRLGTNGLLLLGATNAPYGAAPDTTVVRDARFNQPGGVLDNGGVSFLLATSPGPFVEGQDLDDDDNGTLEDFPPNALILDAVAWKDESETNVVYGGVVLTQISGAADAAVRFPGNNTPLTVDAWFNGDLLGTNGNSLVFDERNLSSDFPRGTPLTPGRTNNTAPTLSYMYPFSSVIGDPTNPRLTFAVTDSETPASRLIVTAHSTNPVVVPDSNLVLSNAGGGVWSLAIHPVQVGYSEIILTASDGSVSNRIAFPYGASEDWHGGGRFHTGTGDASGAIALDANFMLVGDDENETLRVFHRANSGEAAVGFDMGPYLALVDVEDGDPREMDIEGATRVGNRIYWIGSQSTSRFGEVRTNRSRVFCADVYGTGSSASVVFAGRYDYFKDDLLDWDMKNGHGRGSNYYGLFQSAQEGVDSKAPDGSGLAVEGLCMAPGSSNTAYIAFRAPLVPPTNRSLALIVPVTNFATLIPRGGPRGSTRFGAPIELNLGGRGIRSIETRGANCLIVAGIPGRPGPHFPGNFKLFTWDGNPASAPAERSADLEDLSPEAIAELPAPPWLPSTRFQLLSDNGTTVYYGDGLTSKQLPYDQFKKFRSDWVTLGVPVLSPEPFIYEVSASTNRVTLSWFSVTGRTYRVEYKSNLASPTWVSAGTVPASGPTTTKSISPTPPGAAFYRVALP